MTKSLEQQLNDHLAGMDRNYDGNLKGSTKRLLYFQTAQGEQQRKKISETTSKSNQMRYETVWIVRSPGNDLLDFYDEQMLSLDPNSKAYSKIPPSKVFELRFRTEYPQFQRGANRPGKWSYIGDLCKEYYVTKDHTYWSQVYKTRFRWLTDVPHQEWHFKYLRDANQFLKQHLGVHSFKSNNTMFWRGDLAGWSIVESV